MVARFVMADISVRSTLNRSIAIFGISTHDWSYPERRCLRPMSLYLQGTYFHETLIFSPDIATKGRDLASVTEGNGAI